MSYQKMSKTGQAPNQVDKDREALAEMDKKKSKHFAIGTEVIYYKWRYTIAEIHGPWVILVSGDKRVSLYNPYFMQWS